MKNHKLIIFLFLFLLNNVSILKSASGDSPELPVPSGDNLIDVNNLVRSLV